MSKYADLLQRVKAATGPDRELDFLIQTHVANPLTGDEPYTLQDVMDDYALLGPEGMVIDAPFTASIDAALALAERMLPGWAWKLLREEGRFTFVLRNAPKLEVVAPATVASCDDPAFAILAALLQALEATDAQS